MSLSKVNDRVMINLERRLKKQNEYVIIKCLVFYRRFDDIMDEIKIMESKLGNDLYSIKAEIQEDLNEKGTKLL